MKLRKVTISRNSTQWFADALRDPALAHVAKNIRWICANADRLHRTVSGVAGDRTKQMFLKQLRRVILSSEDIGVKDATARIAKLVLVTKQRLAGMDPSLALNPSDWQIAVRFAQVKPKGQIFDGKRGFQGGAPQ